MCAGARTALKISDCQTKYFTNTKMFNYDQIEISRQIQQRIILKYIDLLQVSGMSSLACFYSLPVPELKKPTNQTSDRKRIRKEIHKYYLMLLFISKVKYDKGKRKTISFYFYL